MGKAGRVLSASISRCDMLFFFLVFLLLRMEEMGINLRELKKGKGGEGGLKPELEREQDDTGIWKWWEPGRAWGTANERFVWLQSVHS